MADEIRSGAMPDSMLGAVVSEFYRRVLLDPRLLDAFDGVDMTSLREHQRAFLSTLMHSDPQVQRRTLAKAHRRLSIGDEEFDVTVQHLRESLDAVGVDAAAAELLLSRVARYRTVIVRSR